MTAGQRGHDASGIDVALPRPYIAAVMMIEARIPMNRRRSRSAAGGRV